MHVLAIYSVNEHISDLMAQAAHERLINESKASKPNRRRFAFLTSRFTRRGSTVAIPGPARALAGS